MSRILIIAEHDGSHLNPGSAKCVTCAAALTGASITVAVLARDPQAVASQAAALTGVTEVLAMQTPAMNIPWRPCWRRRLRPSPGISPMSWHRPQPSARICCRGLPPCWGAPQISDIMAIETATRFRRPVYAGNAIVTVEVAAGIQIAATVRTASFAAAAPGGSAPIKAVAPEVTLPTHTRFVSVSAASSDRPDLQTARRVVSGGRALGSAEGFKLMFALADKLGAAVGASRAAVDAGYAPQRAAGGPDRQDHCARAVHRHRHFRGHPASDRHQGCPHHRRHQQGRRGAIFEVADYGLVGDLFEIVPELEKLLG